MSKGGGVCPMEGYNAASQDVEHVKAEKRGSANHTV
jgi:hypothetical protein